MHHDLEKGYVVSCLECPQNKSSTSKPIGPLHPLPIPDQCSDSVTIDLSACYQKIMVTTVLSPLQTTLEVTFNWRQHTWILMQNNWPMFFFFDKWYCENSLPTDIVSDRDKLFISKFWKALHKLMGVKLKLSTAYHPQTDGMSERANKTVNQCL